jgi:histidinol phosphatase-like PHP family hydrolase/predicted nuclease with RNAse H fold/dephospho-CoA kinase
VTLLPKDYFRPRDFEYAQPLYDLAFLLQVDALARQRPVAEYRTFALWKAALHLDGYSTNIDAWLQDTNCEDLLDFKPSPRIAQYLSQIRETGSLHELRNLLSPEHQACLRLRSIRGLGTKQIALALAKGPLADGWLIRTAEMTGAAPTLLLETWEDKAQPQWQAAHVIPPLLRLLHGLEAVVGVDGEWGIAELGDGLRSISNFIQVEALFPGSVSLSEAAAKVTERDPFFEVKGAASDLVMLQHRLGWRVAIHASSDPNANINGTDSLDALAMKSDALLQDATTFLGDLHCHTNWSDGTASIDAMVKAAQNRQLRYLAITDHSRSSKLQGGLTSVAWLRQAVSLSLLHNEAMALHGIETDILDDGRLDLPANLLARMDVVIGSVHTKWCSDVAVNTSRVVKAIESGRIDILGHPSATILGKPGVPTYYRPPVALDWARIFEACRVWNVALEFNCFPSRLDLELPLLKQANAAGCCVAFGSDAHSRAHLSHLRIGEKVAEALEGNHVLNRLPLQELKTWVKDARRLRARSQPQLVSPLQQELSLSIAPADGARKIRARVARRHKLPSGSRVLGLDLTASKAKPTGAAVLEGLDVRTTSLDSDEDILAFVREIRPSIVSIDSPLGLPGGVREPSAATSIVRIAELDLASVGIPAYPALIDSMKPLTLRGMKLRTEIEALDIAPRVIESYPGAAQDILCIPRKQKGLALLRAGLMELGLRGLGLETRSHDEMDAITAAIVGRYYEIGRFEAMGVPEEAQLIVPTLSPFEFSRPPIVCLSGRTGAGKSVVARYLALFYGFHWLRTRHLIRALLLDDLRLPREKRLFQHAVDERNIRDSDLTAFGIVVLEQYRQEPLLRKLRETIAATSGPVVVDAARDVADIESLKELGREVLIWFVDAPDSIVEARLGQRRRPAKASPSSLRKIDQKTHLLSAAADFVLQNDGSLEDIRWRVDNALFGVLSLNGRE